MSLKGLASAYYVPCILKVIMTFIMHESDKLSPLLLVNGK